MIEIVSFKKYEKNTLQGFLTVRLRTIGLEIRDITLHEKEGSQWIGMPSKPYEKDGKTKYSYIVTFYEKETSDKFQAKVLKALAAYRGETPEEEGNPFE